MIRLWRRNNCDRGRKWIEFDEAEDMDEAMRKLARRGPGQVRLTDEKGAEILLATIRHKARQFVTRPRLRIFNPLTLN